MVIGDDTFPNMKKVRPLAAAGLLNPVHVLDVVPSFGETPWFVPSAALLKPLKTTANKELADDEIFAVAVRSGVVKRFRYNLPPTPDGVTEVHPVVDTVPPEPLLLTKTNAKSPARVPTGNGMGMFPVL